jgi:hypothetical protein
MTVPMAHLSLADLTLQRVALTPREAVAVTLAVAREWDRQRSLRGPVALPDVSAIRLHRTGDVSFAVIALGGTQDEARALSMLLGKLLAIDEPGAPRRPIPGGLMLTLAGRVGQVALPTATAEGFRAALLRFTDENPETLVALYQRAAASPLARTARPKPAERRRPRFGERRATPEQLHELRRSVRTLEEQVFTLKGKGPARPPRRWLAAAGAVAAVLVLLAWAAPARVTREIPPLVPATRVAASTDTRPTVRTASASAHAPTATAPAPALRSRPARTAARTPPARPAASTSRRPAPHDVFAGGVRGITWRTAH